jgi:hypothetical protein
MFTDDAWRDYVDTGCKPSPDYHVDLGPVALPKAPYGDEPFENYLIYQNEIVLAYKARNKNDRSSIRTVCGGPSKLITIN